MVCPQCVGVEKLFNEKYAQRELKRYRRKGPAKSTCLLIEAIKTEGVQGLSLLDIGGGVGAIQLELLKSGVRIATDVDAAPAYLKIARDEAERRGFADRVEYHSGDFVEEADDIDPADIVTLDRVICCYPDMPRLVSLSAAKAGKIYGLVYPRLNLLMRFARPIINFHNLIKRSPFRFYLHSPAEVDRILQDCGFIRRGQSRTPLWQIVVFVRGNDGPLSSAIIPS